MIGFHQNKNKTAREQQTASSVAVVVFLPLQPDARGLVPQQLQPAPPPQHCRALGGRADRSTHQALPEFKTTKRLHTNVCYKKNSCLRPQLLG